MKKFVLYVAYSMLISIIANTIELNGFIKSFQINEMDNSYIFLDVEKPITDTNGNAVIDVNKLKVGSALYYSSELLNVLLTACSNKWGIKFNISAIENNASIQSFEAPCHINIVPQNGLVSEYLFNGNISTAGTIYEAFLTDDRFDRDMQALCFDGINDYIDLGKHPLSYNYVSISFWVKTSKTALNYGAFSWNDSNNNCITVFSIDPNPRICFRDNAWKNGNYPRIKGISNVADGKWHHICFVYNGDANLYVDGVLEAKLKRNSTMFYQNLNIVLGHLNNNPVGTYHFEGFVDDLRIYNRDLNRKEIKALYLEW